MEHKSSHMEVDMGQNVGFNSQGTVIVHQNIKYFVKKGH